MMFKRLIKNIGKGIVKALPLSGFIGDLISGRKKARDILREAKSKNEIDSSDLYKLIDLLDDGTLNDSYSRVKFDKIVEVFTALAALIGAGVYFF